MPVQRWRPSVGGLVWVGVWTFPLLDPLSTIDATHGGVLAGVGLGVFTLTYMVITTLGFDHRDDLRRVSGTGFGVVAALGAGLAAAYGEHWLILMLFVATCGMAVYAGRERVTVAFAVLVSVLAATVLLGLLHDALATALTTVIGTVLASGLVGAVRQMQRLIRELRQTRDALATVAVAEERLRFSRDLHDLLGHTLSVIVVKAEVVRRIAERDPPAAAAQAADIEDIGRRALVEIREAVTGYRESGLTAELTRAKGVLSSAGITATVQRTADPLPEAADRLLAWVLREATTNVVRHSGAQRCDIEISTMDGAAALSVVDNGGAAERAASGGASFGNGLRGLTERLGAAGGTLQAGARDGGGFALVARLPL
ncbi:histidine kinase [Dactylosporangium sp. NBC_01737]|uniref:sensor histidine kinase n=1 Tax=Dactylosporangium sp. NBC_01737 TaxID=2975959 RepID=UPI002E114DA3|nr:histidine kinase [Dactylosporangium sp. NBC_01737]